MSKIIVEADVWEEAREAIPLLLNLIPDLPDEFDEEIERLGSLFERMGAVIPELPEGWEIRRDDGYCIEVGKGKVGVEIDPDGLYAFEEVPGSENRTKHDPPHDVPTDVHLFLISKWSRKDT